MKAKVIAVLPMTITLFTTILQSTSWAQGPLRLPNVAPAPDCSACSRMGAEDMRNCERFPNGSNENTRCVHEAQDPTSRTAACYRNCKNNH